MTYPLRVEALLNSNGTPLRETAICSDCFEDKTKRFEASSRKHDPRFFGWMPIIDRCRFCGREGSVA